MTTLEIVAVLFQTNPKRPQCRDGRCKRIVIERHFTEYTKRAGGGGYFDLLYIGLVSGGSPGCGLEFIVSSHKRGNTKNEYFCGPLSHSLTGTGFISR